MSTALGLSDREAAAVSREVLGHALSEFGFSQVEVRSGEDVDGDPALFVTAVLSLGAPGLSAATYDRVYGELDDALRRHGERRFTYFRLSRPEDSDETDGVEAP